MLSMESKGVVVADVLKNPIEKFDCKNQTKERITNPSLSKSPHCPHYFKSL
jgi:hypothetical protein